MSGVCPELTPTLDQLYVLASALDGRSRAVPVVSEHLSVISFGGALLVAGELDIETAPTLASALEARAVPGAEVRIDMAGVTFMGSIGVQLLNRVALAVGPSGRVAVIAASRPVRRTFELLGLPDHVEIVDGTSRN